MQVPELIETLLAETCATARFWYVSGFIAGAIWKTHPEFARALRRAGHEWNEAKTRELVEQIEKLYV